jgi:hypothetical protein
MCGFAAGYGDKMRSREVVLPAPARATVNPSNGLLRYRSMTIFLVSLKPLVSIL